jgi:hypothetical protein
MTSDTRFRTPALFVLTASLCLVPYLATAQQAVSRPVAAPPVVTARTPSGAELAQAMAAREVDADQTREQLDQLLQKYPPTLGRVLKLDPTLLTSDVYLAPYPMLAAFVAEHPEVAHNPSFFFEHVYLETPRNPQFEEEMERRQMTAGYFAGAALLVAFVILTGVVVWVVRTVLDQRRWNAVSKTQYEVHNRVMERMTSNDDLLAYIQTPVGRRLLESGPAPLPGAAQPVGAPFSRILWSVQGGVVLIGAGIGLMLLHSRVPQEAGVFFTVAGVTALAVGIGFVASGGAAYVLAQRLGLLERRDVDHA